LYVVVVLASGLGIHDLLSRGVAQALNQPAFDLPLNDHRVDGKSHVVRTHELMHVDLTGLSIDGHTRKDCVSRRRVGRDDTAHTDELLVADMSVVAEFAQLHGMAPLPASKSAMETL